MAIEVIGREVEQHRDPRVERIRRLELEAADLDDVQRGGRRLRDLRGKRGAQVAARRHVEPGVAENPRGQRGRRGLALGARNGDDPASEPAACQLDLADHRHPGSACGVDRFLRRRDPRTQHEELRRREQVSAMRTGFEGDAKRQQPRGVVNRIEVGERHARAARGQQLGRGSPASARADDHRPFSLNAEAHRLTSA
jgi:hypothetical protein